MLIVVWTKYFVILRHLLLVLKFKFEIISIDKLDRKKQVTILMFVGLDWNPKL